MPYRVYDNSIYDNNKRKRVLPIPGRIRPLYIHIAIIVILILAFIFYFSDEFNFDMSEEQQGTLTLVGQLSDFNQTYSGTLKIYASDFTLKTKDAKIDEKSKDITFENFTGNIYLKNRSMIFTGTAQKIKYGKNTINTVGDTFTLKSTRKTNTEFIFEDINLNFKSGRAKLDDSLNYVLLSSNISLTNFNTSLSYDGTFSFVGNADAFNINSPKQDIIISYSQQNDTETP